VPARGMKKFGRSGHDDLTTGTSPLDPTFRRVSI